VKRKGIKGSRKKNRGEQRRKKEEKKKGERGPEQQQRRNRNENRKKETTATFKPRIPAAATAPLSRCHRHLQPRIPAAAPLSPQWPSATTIQHSHFTTTTDSTIIVQK
jgi:hypothetical protein